MTDQTVRVPQTHELKTWPVPFDAVASGLKTWELRLNDRDYQVGDTLHLLRFDPDQARFTDGEIKRVVTWMLIGPAFGLPEGYCIMTLAAAPSPEAEGAALLPCPFCGGLARLMDMTAKAKKKGYQYVECRLCGVDAGSVAAWNTRAKPSTREAEAPEAEAVAWVARVMEVREEAAHEGVGAWVACSGCQESVDGCVSTRDYPYSAAFGCQPGGGCSECGGLGVLWDTTDWDEAARFMLACDDDHPAPSPASAWKPGREEIARLIDPDAWSFADRHAGKPVLEPEVTFETRRSLAKADMILALPAPPATEGAGDQ